MKRKSIPLLSQVTTDKLSQQEPKENSSFSTPKENASIQVKRTITQTGSAKLDLVPLTKVKLQVFSHTSLVSVGMDGSKSGILTSQLDSPSKLTNQTSMLLLSHLMVSTLLLEEKTRNSTSGTSQT